MPGQCKRMRNKPEVRRSLPVPIYVFDDSEQKFEFKARIQPGSDQSNCIQF